MTDSSNYPSENDPVTEYTITANFIRQYKKYKLAMLEGDFFSVREMQALTASIIATPQAMYSFIMDTQKVMVDQAGAEFTSEEDVAEVIAFFNSELLKLFLNMVVPLLKLPPEEKARLRQAQLDSIKEDKPEAAEATPGLDFSMPNFEPGKNPDV